MTEPSAALQPATQRAHPALAVVPRGAVARPAAAARRPIHVVVAVGLTAGLYAVSLAGVTALQAMSDERLAEDRAPAADAIARLKLSHDALDSRLTQLDGSYSAAAERYKAVADGIADHEKALDVLGKQVKTAAGSAAALSVPSTRLPAVSRSTVYVSTRSAGSGSSRPVVNACTTASGKPC